MGTDDRAALLPWDWTITVEDPARETCPSPAAILGTFAAVNIIVSVLGVVCGHRIVVKKMTFGLLGGKGGRAWLFMWPVTLALQLGANALIAKIIKDTPGYHATFGIGELTLFLVARPRLSWIFIILFSERSRKIKNKSEIQSPFISKDKTGERPWGCAAMSQLFAETILLFLGFITMGKTARFADTHGYYKLGSVYNTLPRGAHLMYAGALYFLVAGVLAFITYLVMVPIMVSDMLESNPEPGQGDYVNDGMNTAFVSVGLFCFWMGSWIFWAGFVYLAGDL
jgi:hypothetical protein